MRTFGMKVFVGLFAMLAFSAGTLKAETGTVISSEGERLERRFWEEMKAQNWPAVEAQIAPGFQSAHPDGARNRAGEIALIKNLHLGDYDLTDFQITQSTDTLIVTYKVSVRETIDGKVQPTKPAPRLSVWQKNGLGWQWIAHANLNP